MSSKNKVLYDEAKYGVIIYELIKSISKGNPNLQTKLYMKLGYDYMRDPGLGIITWDILNQVVFFNIRSFEVVDSSVYSDRYNPMRLSEAQIYATLNSLDSSIDDVLHALNSSNISGWNLHCGNFKRFRVSDIDELDSILNLFRVIQSIRSIRNKNNLLLCINPDIRIKLLGIHFFTLIGENHIELNWLKIIPSNELESLFHLISDRLLSEVKANPSYKWNLIYSAFNKPVPEINLNIYEHVLNEEYYYYLPSNSKLKINDLNVSTIIRDGVIYNIGMIDDSYGKCYIKIKPKRYCFVVYEPYINDSLKYHHQIDNIYSISSHESYRFRFSDFKDLLNEYDTIYFIDPKYNNESMTFITNSDISEVKVVKVIESKVND